MLGLTYADLHRGLRNPNPTTERFTNPFVQSLTTLTRKGSRKQDANDTYSARKAAFEGQIIKNHPTSNRLCELKERFQNPRAGYQD
mmetsp:Transcript_29322/g.113645  ORF Transcript_29322/g.113645 Transcript_29322/m.113645 type:complete len:86 (+) Transcript_29322:139-396(+)